MDFDTRFAGKSPITTANFGTNFDTAFTGKNPITTTNFGTTFDAAFTGKNPVTTGVEGNFDDLFDGKVPTGYETWNALATNATNGNEALSKFSGAGGKLPIDGVIPPGDYTGWGEINTDIAKGISADSDLNGLDFSIDNSDPNNPIVKINKGGSRGFATNTIGKSSIGLGNVANESPTTIRQGITIDENGALQGIGNGSGTTISNNRVTLQLAGQTLTFNNGTSSPILLDSGNVGLGNVENKSSTDIRNEIQIVNGVLNGIGTSGIVVNNASIGLSRDPTSGEITLNKGVGTPVTVNPFTATRFTEVSGVAESALTNAATAQNTADTANLLANTIEGRFTSGKLNEANAADALKNSNVTKSSIDLGNVANESPATIRSGITVTNGVLSGIGTANIVVDNSSISLTTDSTSGEITLNKGVGSAITVNPFASTTFTTVSSTATSAQTAAGNAQTAAGNAQTAAEAAQATADDAEAEIGSLEVTGSPNIPGAIFLKSSRGQLGENITATQLLLGELVNQSPYKIRKSIKNLVLGNTLYTREIAELDVSIFEELSNIDTLEWASSTASQVITAQTAPYIGTKFLTLRDGDFTKELRWLQYKKEITGSCTIKCRVLKSSINGTRYDPAGLNLEYPDSGENLVIQTSTDGINWTTHTTLMQGATSTQTVYTSTVIDNINDPYFVRIKQINYSNSSSDHYAINDISIESNTYDTDLEPAISSIATTVAANQISNKQPRTVFLYDDDITITEPLSYRIIDARTQATSRTIYISDIVLTGIGTEIEIIFSKNSGVKAADITLSISPALALIYSNQTGNPVSSYAIYENKRFICSGGLYLV